MSKTTWVRGRYGDGVLHYETPYVNDKVHGVEKVYHGNGKRWCETPYVNDKMHGVQKIYHNNGRPSHKVYYIHGNEVTGVEWKKHKLVIALSGIKETT